MSVAIIIPSKDEPYLKNTVEDILTKAKGHVKVFVNIDGNMPKDLVKDKHVKYAHNQKPIGLRGGVNLGIENTSSKYIMKVDAHCMFAEGFDEVLVRDCKENQLMIPRRYSLNTEYWRRGKGHIKDYHFLHFPLRGRHGLSMTPQEWLKKTYDMMDRPEYEVDYVMTMQGSCWFANRSYFMDKVGYLDTNRYGTFVGEHLEIGMNYWTSGGSMKVNKRTWYAHLFKNRRYYKEHKSDRSYKVGYLAGRSYDILCRDWFEDAKQLVERFWPVPTWPKDRSLWKLPSVN